jgi:hypothetical protein
MPPEGPLVSDHWRSNQWVEGVKLYPLTLALVMVPWGLSPSDAWTWPPPNGQYEQLLTELGTQ